MKLGKQARIVRASDAPRALTSRATRRQWASAVNRAYRTNGGDEEDARKAGARLAMAALDCDAGIAAHVSKAYRHGTGQSPPFTLPRAAKLRDRNVDGVGDDVCAAIMRDEAQPFTAADRRQEAQKRHAARSFIRGKGSP